MPGAGAVAGGEDCEDGSRALVARRVLKRCSTSTSELRSKPMTRMHAILSLSMTLATTVTVMSGCVPDSDGGDDAEDAAGDGATPENGAQPQVNYQYAIVNLIVGPSNGLGGIPQDWYVAATNGGGSNVTVNRATGGSWEQFRLVPTDTIGHYAIQTVSKGLYLSAQGGGGGAVTADRVAVGPWETFFIPDPWTPNLTFRTSNGHWLSADQNGCGNCSLNARASAASTWEHFVAVPPSSHRVYKEIWWQGLQLIRGDEIIGPTIAVSGGSRYHVLRMQTDGNFVLYRVNVDAFGRENWAATWAPPSNACVNKGLVAQLTPNGNLTVLEHDGRTACWQSNTPRFLISSGDVQGDGNFVL